MLLPKKITFVNNKGLKTLFKRRELPQIGIYIV